MNRAAIAITCVLLAGVCFGQSVDYDGTDDYLVATYDPSFDFVSNTPFTVSAWVDLDTTNFGVVASSEQISSPRRGFGLYASGGQFNIAVRFALWGGSSTEGIIVDIVGGLPVATLTHLVATFDGSGKASGVALYVDGAAAVDSDVTDTLNGANAASRPLLIGRRDDAAPFSFDGAISPLKLWDYALSPEQIGRLYQRESLTGGKTNGVARSVPTGASPYYTNGVATPFVFSLGRPAASLATGDTIPDGTLFHERNGLTVYATNEPTLGNRITRGSR